MALSHRRSLLATVAALLVFIIFFTSKSPGQLANNKSFLSPSQPNSQTQPPPPSKNPHKLTGGTFNWNQVPIQFPVDQLISLPSGIPKSLRKIQHPFSEEETVLEESVRLQRRDAISDAFEKCYKSYKERAWMKDELAPISGGYHDAFGGWAATLVDSLDTLAIMGLHEELRDAIAAVDRINFSTSTDSIINVFETTIRYLGGFLSAYDLTEEEILLKKAKEVGEMLLVAFDTPNHLPVCRWHWEKAAAGKTQEASSSTLVSEIGSLSVEFIRLAQITQDMRWYDAVARITTLFDQQQDATLLPGMWPVTVNARDMVLTDDNYFTLGGMSDSLYEYFPKAYALLGGLEPVYQKLYEGSMSTSIKHLFYRPMIPEMEDILISGNVRARPSGATLDPQGQHLGCFTGGMLALGGRLFDYPEHIDIARKLTEGCIWAYNASAWNIMPETFHLVPCNSTETCQWDSQRWKDAVFQIHGDGDDVDDIIRKRRLPPGFTDIGDARYILRPEAIESVFILYRVTGDKAFQEAAWQMWTTISKLTETKLANAALDDVTTAESPAQADRMESFWMAETLKYFYLIFSEPDFISLDDYILNTEAHPFKRPG